MRRAVVVYERLIRRFTAQTTDYQVLLSTFAGRAASLATGPDIQIRHCRLYSGMWQFLQVCMYSSLQSNSDMLSGMLLCTDM